MSEELKNSESNVSKFEKELTELLNGCSMENGSDTPDFILASFLKRSLANFNECVNEREVWYNRMLPEEYYGEEASNMYKEYVTNIT